MLEITRSTRHQKIIGNFGENLICNWLSRSGFEVTIVDHNGIDIVAYHPKLDMRLGITVKSRTRTIGKEAESVYIFSYRNGKNDYKTYLKACNAFACEPWIGIYVETTDYGEMYLTSLKNYQDNYRGAAERAVDDWKMTPVYREKYRQDKSVKFIRIDFQPENWDW